MIEQRILEKFYSKIFSVPKKRVSVTIGIASIVFASYLNGISGKSFFAMRYFFIGLALIILLLFIGKALNSGFNSRRIFFLSLFLLLLIEIADAISIHLLDPELIVVSPSAIAFVLTATLYFTSEKYSHVVPFLLLLLLYPVDYFYSFTAFYRFTAYTIASISGVFLGFAFIIYLKRRIGRIVVADVLRDFVLYWLKGEPKIFEERLKRYSEVSQSRVFLLKFNGVTLFIPEFHPGPFRDIGGAKLVKRALEKYSLFLHGLSSHELNPVCSEDVESIVNSVKVFSKTKPLKPYSVEGERLRLKVYPFSDFSLIIIHGKEKIDDIPNTIRKIAERFIKNPIIVDAHNAYSEGYDLTIEDVSEIYILLEEASKTKSIECQKLEMSYFEDRYESDSICGELRLILLSFDGERHGIFMVDSNNMRKELRVYLENLAKRHGVNLDVVTTDNHSKTGVSPKIGYKPAGIEDLKPLEEFLKKAFENAKFRNCWIEFGYTDVRARVMGKGFFKEIEIAFREFGEKALYMFFLFAILNYLISFALSSIII